jgi:hypothetical protein
MGDQSAAENLRHVVHPPLQAVGVEVEDLPRIVRGDRLREVRREPAPPLIGFAPWLDLARLNSGNGEEEGCREIVPERVAEEIPEVRPLPGGGTNEALESGPRVTKVLDQFASLVSIVTRSGLTSKIARRFGSVKGSKVVRSTRVSMVTDTSVSGPSQPLIFQRGPPMDT